MANKFKVGDEVITLIDTAVMPKDSIGKIVSLTTIVSNVFNAVEFNNNHIINYFDYEIDLYTKTNTTSVNSVGNQTQFNFAIGDRVVNSYHGIGTIINQGIDPLNNFIYYEVSFDKGNTFWVYESDLNTATQNVSNVSPKFKVKDKLITKIDCGLCSKGSIVEVFVIKYSHYFKINIYLVKDNKGYSYWYEEKDLDIVQPVASQPNFKFQLGDKVIVNKSVQNTFPHQIGCTGTVLSSWVAMGGQNTYDVDMGSNKGNFTFYEAELDFVQPAATQPKFKLGDQVTLSKNSPLYSISRYKGIVGQIISIKPKGYGSIHNIYSVDYGSNLGTGSFLEDELDLASKTMAYSNNNNLNIIGHTFTNTTNWKINGEPKLEKMNLNYAKKVPCCECGAHKCGHEGHSSWCPLYL